MTDYLLESLGRVFETWDTLADYTGRSDTHIEPPLTIPYSLSYLPYSVLSEAIYSQ